MRNRFWLMSLASTKCIGVILISLFHCASTHAATIWESHDAQYSLSLIGFFNIDVADFRVDPVADAGLPIDEGFQQAKAVGHFSSRLGHRVSVFMETELTVSENEIDLEVERIVAKYDIDDNSQFSLGRFHAPVGFWNQFYHHGRWLQVSKDRPIQAEFGSGFLPGHYWGGMYEHRFSTPNLTIDLDLGFGGGRDKDIEIPGFSESISSKSAVLAQINVTPAKVRALTVGGSFWVGGLSADSLADVDENIVTAHINYEGATNQFLAEVSAVEHDYADARATQNDTAYYLQYSRRLSPLDGRLQAYARFDHVDMDADDFVYSGLRPMDRGTLGLRFDVSQNSAIKLELRRDRFRDTSQSISSAQAQYSTVFH